MPPRRDELNLAEYPITLLAERVPPGLKTIDLRFPYSEELIERRSYRPTAVGFTDQRRWLWAPTTD